jgi:ubiquitin carboxyl-terminal hydrolase 12/46
MGQGTSRPLEEVVKDLPDSERYFGLENFGNTCYCNSVLQALYFCGPFRSRVLLEHEQRLGSSGNPKKEETILSCLAELFWLISANKRKSGSLSPRRFVNKVKAENELFRSFAHQDAHEFLSYLLNDIADTLAKEKKVEGKGASDSLTVSAHPSRSPSLQELHGAAAKAASESPLTWIDELFRGKLVTETKCLWCENITRREEPFYDLSLEIEQNCSLSACLKQFSSDETLQDGEKFFCDTCGRKQEAVKRMRVGSLPRLLCLHFKRFKYMESLGEMKKLTHRVVFPFELKLTNTTEDCPDPDSEYTLQAIVVHMGAHMNHGHYVALIKTGGKWLCFDDDQVLAVTDAQVRSTYGHTRDPMFKPAGNMNTSMDHGYILFYQRNDVESSFSHT